MNLVHEGVLPPDELDDRDERRELAEALEALKPRNCGECARFVRNPDCPSFGWCDKWGDMSLTDNCVCNPNCGVKKEDNND